MVKKIFIIVTLILLISSCDKIKQNDNINRFYLNDEFYSKGDFVKVENNDLINLENENYILFTYNNYCNMAISCENIFQNFMKKYKIDFLSITFEEFKKTNFYNSVKYAPSIIIIHNGAIVDYLDANSDNDLKKYQDVNEFEKWLNNYIYFSK